ncbi:hypothetical protein [Clostridium tagluense]|uniref:Uncharacterized protein n=1 Tax=Clostridium tagluense TaxID=360422 RepID=A0A401ULK1_9CLOT|nr:hypothetical protein [Clostridium tagluense]GCD10407.1 hypothetical protein Ctaglu_20300 [Clostridium tagluense]
MMWFNKKTEEQIKAKLLKDTRVDVYNRYRYEITFINGDILEVTDTRYSKWKFIYFVDRMLAEETIIVGECQYTTSSILKVQFIDVLETIRYRRKDVYYTDLGNIVWDKKYFKDNLIID